MSFQLKIQADYGKEMLINVHPLGKPSSGKAVMAFLMGLVNYNEEINSNNDDEPTKSILYWYQNLEQLAGESFKIIYKPLIDCMWGDGGDPIEYKEDEFEYYQKRNPGTNIDKVAFQKYIKESGERWKPIDQVIKGVRILTELFSRNDIEQLEGFYEPKNTFIDFEALSFNLELLERRGNKFVRLNFN